MGFATSFTATGTVAATNNTNTLNGTGTKFLWELTVGSVIVVSGQTRTVSAIATDISLTVTANFTPAFSSQTFTSDSTLVSGAETFDGLATFNGSNPTRGSATESTIAITHPIVFASGATLTKGTSKRNTIKLGDATKYFRITSRDFTNANQGVIDFGTEGVMIFEGRGFIGNGAPTIAAMVRADYLTAVMNYSAGNSAYIDMFYRSLNTIAALDVPQELTIVLANTFKCSFGILFKPSLGTTIGAIKFVEGDNYDGTTDKLAFIVNTDDGGTIPPITHPKINNSQTISYFRNQPDGANYTGTIILDRQTIKYNLNVIMYTWCGGTHNLDNAILPSGFSADIRGYVSSLAAEAATQQVRYSFTAPLYLAASGWKIRMWDDTETQIDDASLAAEHKIIWRKLVNAKDNVERSLTQRTNAKIRLRKQGYAEVNLEYAYYNARVDYLAPPLADALWSNTGTITNIVDAYQLYDEYMKILAADLSIAQVCYRSGPAFDLVGNSLVLDGTAASLITLVGTTLTIKTTTYAGGATATTGKTTVKNGALLDGGTFDCDVDYDNAAGTTIAGVTHTGTWKFSASGTHTLDGSNLDEVTNSSGGAVVLNLDVNSSVTTNTGPNITVNVPTGQIDFAGLIAGSQVVVFEAGTTTEVFRDNNSGATETTGSINAGTYDYTVMKAGYFPIRIPGVVVGTSPVAAQIAQEEDRAWVASSGLTYGTTATLTGPEFAVTVATTVQNWYSFWIEAWIAQASRANMDFPLVPFGSNSFTLRDGYEFSAGSIQYLSRDGFRYVDGAGAVTAQFCAVISAGVQAGSQVEYYFDVSAVEDANSTGNIDQVIQYFGDATHGNFDYTNYLDLKVQTNGYRQAESSVTETYGPLEETLYVVSLTELAIPGLTLGDPAPTGLSITDDSAAPVSWDAGDGAKDYSITITDTGSNTGETILRWLNYNLSLDVTFQGKDPFQWPELALKNGANYETIWGNLHLAGGDVLCGVRVIDGSGDPHPAFSRFQSDDGSYGTPPASISVTAPSIIDGSSYVLYVDGTPLDWGTISGGSGYSTVLVEGVDFTVGDSILFMAGYQSGGVAKLPFRASGTAGTGDLSFNDSQVAWTYHDVVGIDGSAVSECDTNYVQIQVEVDDADNLTLKSRIAAFIVDAIGTVDGLMNWVDDAGTPAIRYISAGSAVVDKSVVDLEISNVKAGTTLRAVDAFQLRASDGSSLIDNSTYSIDWDNGAEAVVVTTGGTALSPEESAKILGLPSNIATKPDVFNAANM